MHYPKCESFNRNGCYSDSTFSVKHATIPIKIHSLDVDVLVLTIRRYPDLNSNTCFVTKYIKTITVSPFSLCLVKKSFRISRKGRISCRDWSICQRTICGDGKHKFEKALEKANPGIVRASNQFLRLPIYLRTTRLNIFTSPPIGGGRGIVMPMSVCLCVCLCVCLFVRVFAKFQSVISQPFLNRSLWNLAYILRIGTPWLTNIFRILGQRSRS